MIAGSDNGRGIVAMWRCKLTGRFVAVRSSALDGAIELRLVRGQSRILRAASDGPSVIFVSNLQHEAESIPSLSPRSAEISFRIPVISIR